MAATSNYAPTVSIDSVSYNELEATFSVTTDDADGDTLTYLFNYGDGQIGSNKTHIYAQDGHYLVSCTVTDNHGVSQTDWLFITIFTNGNFSKAAPTNAGHRDITHSDIDVGEPAAEPPATSTVMTPATTTLARAGRVTAQIPALTLSGLSLNTTYYWQVRASNAAPAQSTPTEKLPAFGDSPRVIYPEPLQRPLRRMPPPGYHSLRH